MKVSRQAQGIQVAKEKGVYKGRPLLYSPNAKDPQNVLSTIVLLKC